MKYYLSPFILCLTLVSCTRTPSEPMTSEPDKTSEPIPFLKDTLLLDAGAYCNIETPLIYEDKLIIMITNWETKEGWIQCLDKNSLELLWTWKEAMEEFGVPAKGFGFISHIHDGILAIAQSNLSYGIDIETGSTIWKNRAVDSGASAIFGNDEVIANARIVDSKTHDAIIVSEITNGIWSTIFNHIQDDSMNVAIGAPIPFSWKGKKYLTFISGKWSSAPPLELTWLNLYNLTDDRLEWTSDTIPLHQPLSGTPGNQPKFEDGQILLGNDAIYSYNVEDGSLEWWKWYGNSFVIGSHLTVADGVVYANNDDQFLLGLEVHTGEEVINTTSGGSVSPIAYHGGKCYMSSVTVGGTNRLMIIDGKTGEIVQNEKAPFRDEDSRWTFEQAIAVDYESGLVYTADHRYLLVYDFDL